MRELRERKTSTNGTWQEKLDAELEMTHRRLEIEKTVRSTSAKLPKLKITPFKGTPTDWVRFENMLVTQVQNKPITEEEKFGYLLEMVSPKVRGRIVNLKPSALGYKIVWERLEKEYGQTKPVVNTHVEEIMNLPTVKGSNFSRVQEFYEKVSRNYDALLTMGQGNMLQGFVTSTLNKLPQVRPDLVRTDDNWENWDMETLINNLQRNKTEDHPGHSGDPPRGKSTGSHSKGVTNRKKGQHRPAFIATRATGETHATPSAHWRFGESILLTTGCVSTVVELGTV